MSSMCIIDKGGVVQGLGSLQSDSFRKAKAEANCERVQEYVFLERSEGSFCWSVVAHLHVPFAQPMLTFIRDTVSSVGLIRGDVFLSTSASSAHACHFRHALALDELRVKFMPEYFHEMNSQSNDSISKYIVQKNKGIENEPPPSCATDNSNPTMTSEIKEVWFAGSHSDVYVLVHNQVYVTDILSSAEVALTGQESRIKLAMSRCCGCAVKQLRVALF